MATLMPFGANKAQAPRTKIILISGPPWRVSFDVPLNNRPLPIPLKRPRSDEVSLEARMSGLCNNA